MGERTYVNMTTRVNTQVKSKTARLPFDVPLVLITVCLLVIGLLMVYSSSWDASLLIDKPTTYVFSRQVLWVGLSVIIAGVVSFIDYHFYEKYLVYMMGFVVVMLLAVLIQGDVRFNSSRALFGGSIQPAELAKLAIIIYLSYWLYKKQETLTDITLGLLPLIVILGLVAGLIMAQPDLSAAITVGFLGIMLFFLAGGDWKQLIIILIGGAIVIALVVTISTTGKVRMEQYLNGLQNPILGSYHIRRTFEAIIKGRIFGVGIGQATTKFTGLPLPHTDSIFAVIAEETGLVGSFIVIILYVLLFWRGLAIAKRAPDQLGSLLAFGLISWIGIEAMMNIAVIVGLMPFTGNALPLISAGGSSMMTTLTAIGITLNISRQGALKTHTERSGTNATVNLRRRDWRRSVSGLDRGGEFEQE